MTKVLSSIKLNPVLLSVILLLVSTSLTLGIFYYGLPVALLSAIVLIGIPLVVAIVIYPKFGIIVLLIAAYLIMFIIRIGVDFPLGTLMDGIQLLLILGFFVSQKINPSYQKLKNPITLVVVIWVSYNLLQIANPTAESRLAWLYSIRAVAIVTIMYFIFLTQIKTVSFIKLIFKIWIGLAFIAALYAFKQEYIGFFDFEFKTIDNPLQRSLLFIGGRWRKFSIFSDPVAFSYNMATCATLCMVLIFNTHKLYKKFILFFLVAVFMMAMLFSGTRGAYVLLPGAIFLLAILKFNKKILLFSGASLIFFLILIFIPTGNQTIQRFQSAFRPSDDASYNLRKINQKRIQPFIQSHPFGGGLGATGTWGSRFSPNSYLANFPPDSGYVRVAVELGWMGLFIFCTFMFVILFTGIKNYYAIKDPELKNYCLAMTLVVFVLHIGNFPQEALVQFPNSIYFYLFVALINVTYILDQQKQKEILAQKG